MCAVKKKKSLVNGSLSLPGRVMKCGEAARPPLLLLKCGHQPSPETSLHPNLSTKFGEIPVVGQGGGCGSALEAPLLGASSLEEM